MFASLHAITVSRGSKLHEKWLNLCSLHSLLFFFFFLPSILPKLLKVFLELWTFSYPHTKYFCTYIYIYIISSKFFVKEFLKLFLQPQLSFVPIYYYLLLSIIDFNVLLTFYAYIPQSENFQLLNQVHLFFSVYIFFFFNFVLFYLLLQVNDTFLLLASV